MTIRRYYELSLFVPLAVPLLMALAGFGFGSEPGPWEPEFRSFQLARRSGRSRTSCWSTSRAGACGG